MQWAILFVCVLTVLLWDALGLLHLVSPDREVFWAAINAVATCGVGIVAWYQIRELERQQRGWETLRICNLFDIDPTLMAAQRALDNYMHLGASVPASCKLDVRTLANYFDSIAIGVDQGFYRIEIVKAHLGTIMKEYREALISDAALIKLGFSKPKESYSAFLNLVDSWTNGL